MFTEYQNYALFQILINNCSVACANLVLLVSYVQYMDCTSVNKSTKSIRTRTKFVLYEYSRQKLIRIMHSLKFKLTRIRRDETVNQLLCSVSSKTSRAAAFVFR